MSLVAEYEIACEHLPLVEVAGAVPVATLTVDVGQPNQGGPPPFVVQVGAEQDGAVAHALDRAAFVDAYAEIPGRPGTVRYRVLPAASMEEQLGDHVDDLDALRELATTDTVVARIEVTPEGWRQQRWFADREEFDRYCAFWRERADSFSLYRLRDATAVAESTPADGLTDPQREALRTAHELGHFEIPRRASLADVAAELDITASSLSERLRRAQSHLVETTVAATGAYKRPHGLETEGGHSAVNH